MIFTLQKITFLCVKYRMLQVKQPEVASDVSPETKPLKNSKETHPKKKLFCVDVLSMDANIFYSFVVNEEVTFPCACRNAVCTQPRKLFVFAGSPLLSYSFTV